MKRKLAPDDILTAANSFAVTGAVYSTRSRMDFYKTLCLKKKKSEKFQIVI